MKALKSRMIAMLLVLILMLPVLPRAYAAGGFQAVVTSGSMKVYQQSSPYKYLGTLPKGTTVTVNACSGQAALISYNGKTGIARVSDMKAVTAAAAPEAPATPDEAFEKASSAELAAARTMVTTKATRVYKTTSKKSKSVSVKAGVSLNVLGISGSIARVERGGVVGYMSAACLADPAAQATPAPTVQPTQASQEDAPDVVQYNNVAVFTSKAAKVYAKASTSSAYISVDKGTPLTLVAVKGDCAMVKKDGKVGYISTAVLTTEISATPTPAPTATPAPTSSVSLSGTNEQIVYRFLTQVMNYNSAAACGVMANIKYESGYKPTSGGDKGSSYGIVQWHGARKTRLINWCAKNGYDYTTLVGQLYFLQYELKTYYPSVHNKLKAVSNTEQGAYDAGYAFCYNFEAPSNRASRSVTRGNYAKATLWQKYKV